MIYKNLRVRAVFRFGNGMLDTRRKGGLIPLYSTVLCYPLNDEEQKNLRAYCIDRLGGSQRQDPEVFEEI
jgi:hypothetical protein